MPEQAKSSWIYHPLNGQETLKWIFADAWAKLSQDGQFATHLSYHNPTYTIKLEISAFDASSKGVTNGAVAVSDGQMTTSKEEIPQNRIKLVSLETRNDDPLREPDKARELLDEGRYKTVSKDGILVDEKVKKETK